MISLILSRLRVTPTIQVRSLFLEAVKAGIIPGMVGDGSDADFVDTAKTVSTATICSQLLHIVTYYLSQT